MRRLMCPLLFNGLFLICTQAQLPTPSLGPDPAKILINAAVSKAKTENKVVFVCFISSPSSSLDMRLEELFTHPEFMQMFNNSYVFVKLVTNQPPDKKSLENFGADKFLDTWGGTKAGHPFMVFLNANGKMITNSNRLPNGENIGCPATQEEIDAFSQILKETAPRITADQRNKISAYFLQLANPSPTPNPIPTQKRQATASQAPKPVPAQKGIVNPSPTPNPIPTQKGESSYLTPEKPPIAPHLLNDPNARSVRVFCESTLRRNFQGVQMVVNAYAVQRDNLNKSLPSAVAMKRFNEMIASQEQMFNAGNGPFYIGNMPLQQFLPKGASIFVTDVKSETTPFGGAKIYNVFVRVQYPENIAPKYGVSVKRLKTTYMVVPAANGWILAPPRSGTPASLDDSMNAVFSSQIQLMSDLDEYWEIPNKDKLLLESRTSTKELGALRMTINYNDTGLVTVKDTELIIGIPTGSSMRKSVRGIAAPEGSVSIWFGDFDDVDSSVVSNGAGGWCIRVWWYSPDARNRIETLIGSRDKALVEKFNAIFAPAYSAWVEKYKKVVDENPNDPILKK